MVTLVRPVQLKKALLPMLVTLLGMVTLVRPVQREKAAPAIPFVPSSKTMLVFAGIVPLYLYATFAAYTKPSGWLSNHAVLEKASFPMLVTLSGMVTLVRPVQSEKASCPMLVTLFPMVTLVRLVQLSKA